jgi:hypothetical protein
MGDPETSSEKASSPEPEIAGAPIGQRKPETVAVPVTNPEIPELQDRRRPLP